MVDAQVARMMAGILLGEQVAQRERIVGPEAAAAGEVGRGRVSLAADDQAAGTGQARLAGAVLANFALRAALDERVFGE